MLELHEDIAVKTSPEVEEKRATLSLWIVNSVIVHALQSYTGVFAFSFPQLLFLNWILTCWSVSKGK